MSSARYARSRRVAVLVSSPSGFHRLFATRPVRSETNKQFGDQVLTMVLFGTRGPQLFRVVRGGLGSRGRLSARGTQRLTYQLRLALDPECLKNPANHHQKESRGWNGWPETLKLFVVSNSWRRSALPSSRWSK